MDETDFADRSYNPELLKNSVISGLEQLAFGRTNDATELAFSEKITPAKIRRADLFNVSSIKTGKDGGIEIKFFDRQNALEMLAEYSERFNSQSNAKSLVESIYGKSDDEAVASAIPPEEESE